MFFGPQSSAVIRISDANSDSLATATPHIEFYDRANSNEWFCGRPYSNNDKFIIPLMCIMCVAIPFVLVTIAPRFITGAEVNLFFLLETILGPIWVWIVIKEEPSLETIIGGIIIIITIAVHSFLAIKKTQLKSN